MSNVMNIPNGWVETTLGDVVTFQRGFDLPTKDRKTGNYPLMVSNGQDGTHNEFMVKAPGIITGRSGTLGNVFYVAENFWPLNTTLWVKDFKDNEPKFVYYFLKTFPFENYNSGSGVPTLNRNHIHPLPVTIPQDLNEQKSIAAILTAFDDKIELLQAQNKTLEELAQTIFKEWFGKYQIEDELPEGWNIGKLGDVGQIICGKTPSKSNDSYFGNDIPFIKIPDMHNKMFILETLDNLSSEGAKSQINKMIPKNSICVSCIATVGLVAITTKDSQTNQQINSIVLHRENLLEYLYFTLNNLKDYLNDLGSGGTATLNVNTSTFSNIEIIIPLNNKLDDFHILVKPIFEKVLKNNHQIQTLTQTRDELLPKLMSGEIRVKN